jgi:tetratricopeptide (TPR) repeat protein
LAGPFVGEPLRVGYTSHGARIALREHVDKSSNNYKNRDAKMKSGLSVGHGLPVLVAIVAMSITSTNVSAENTKQKSPAAEQPSKERTLLVKGGDALKKGEAEKAITEYFDPVIQHYTEIYKGETKRIYSAQNQMQAIMYVALPDDKKLGTEVVDGTWADAYLMKAYALTELGKLKEAQQALESAIGLSPMNSQYLSELAYTYQAMKDCDKSIEKYTQAASMAELASEEATKTTDLTRAWRGRGYCLVEQGKLEEAEAMYRKSLALDPKDDKSKGELNYIQGLKSGKK